MSTHHYPLEVRARAMESLRSGVAVVDVARFIGCTPNTISRWYLDYRGYQGKEGITITLQHKIKEDMTELSHNQTL